jgi:hypothetical protein
MQHQKNTTQMSCVFLLIGMKPQSRRHIYGNNQAEAGYEQWIYPHACRDCGCLTTNENMF